MPNNRTYIDLNESFVPHPITGDLTRVFDGNAISASIKNLILTNHYESLFRPWAGGNLVALLFEPATPVIEYAIESSIRATIDQEEPRAAIKEIIVKYNESFNSYEVRMSFSVISLDRPVVVNIILKRAR